MFSIDISTLRIMGPSMYGSKYLNFGVIDNEP